MAPAELESLLLQHPDVADAAVIGVPDFHKGEVPMAWVVKSSGSTVSEKDLTDFVAGNCLCAMLKSFQSSRRQKKDDH